VPYGLTLVTPPTAEPVTLASLRAWLRVDDDDTTQDQEILALGQAARRYLEQQIGKVFVSQKWQVTFDRFPSLWWIGSWGNSYQDYQGYQGPSQGAGQGNWQWTLDGKTLRLPNPPLQTVDLSTGTGFSYINTSGSQSQLAATTVAASVAAGNQTVTPASMNGITTGTALLIDDDTNQENVTVAAVTATTFTAVFAQAHTGTFNVYGFQQAKLNNEVPGLLCPVYGIAWPIARAQYDAVRINYTAGYGPVSSIAASIASGTQTVTPASMTGIFKGTRLWIDSSAAVEELVTVTAITATTFTAVFANVHASGASILPGMSKGLYTAIKMLAAHWYEDREAVGQPMSELPLALKSLIYSEWTGEAA
jgi:hypothetical protein